MARRLALGRWRFSYLPATVSTRPARKPFVTHVLRGGVAKSASHGTPRALEGAEKGVNFVERATPRVQPDRGPFQLLVEQKRSDWLLDGRVQCVHAAGSPRSFGKATTKENQVMSREGKTVETSSGPSTESTTINTASPGHLDATGPAVEAARDRSRSVGAVIFLGVGMVAVSLSSGRACRSFASISRMRKPTTPM